MLLSDDHAAFGELVRRHQCAVRHFLRHLRQYLQRLLSFRPQLLRQSRPYRRCRLPRCRGIASQKELDPVRKPDYTRRIVVTGLGVVSTIGAPQKWVTL